MVKAIPAGYHTITPHFTVKDARKAIDFYTRAFGAKEKMVMPGPGGRGVMHAELEIADSPFMLNEENPQNPSKSAETLGNSPVSFYVYVQDADAAQKKAIAAGAKEKMAVTDMFWGDRMGSVEDPFGYTWSIATHKKDVSPAEMAKAAEEFFAQVAAKR